MPPKSSIREIRINSNPFASEFDTPGFGRIQIFTKPGTANAYHASGFFHLLAITISIRAIRSSRTRCRITTTSSTRAAS